MAVKASHSRALGSRKVGSLVFILAVTLLLANSFILAAETVKRPTVEPSAGLVRYRVFSLKNISAEQGSKFLTEAGLGTVSQFPGTNTILVTAQPDELSKAGTILNLVDSAKEFVIKKIVPASEAENLPSNDKIAAEVNDISIGTFSNPPARAETGAIIDVYKDAVIAIAPVEQLEKIIFAIEQLQKPRRMKWRDGEPSDRPTVPEQVAPEIEQPGEVAPAVWQGRSYQPETIANGDEILELTLPEKLTIVQLLELVGQYLQLDYMYDPTKITGDVTLKLGGELSGPIKVKDLYPLLESVLKFRGYVMTRKGNLVTIVPVAEAPTIDPVLIDDAKGEIQAGDVIISRIFNLRYIDTSSAKNLLIGMKLGVDINTSLSGTGTLIVTGYAHRMARIEELLAMVDRAGETRQFRFRQLIYTMAKMLSPQIKTLAEQLGTVSITVSTTTTAATSARRSGESEAAYRTRMVRERAARPQPTPTPAAVAKPTVYLDADERTNRILMIGLQEQLVVVEQLIDALDVEQQDLRTLQLYEIQHVGAEEAKKKLEELGIIGAGRTTSRITVSAPSAKAPAPRPPTPTTTTTTTEALVGEPQVVIVEATNSLLVNATAEQHTQIAMIISYVDSQTLDPAIPYVVYPLENQDPELLAGVLNQLVLETTTRQDKEAKITTTTKRLEEDIFIIPDPKTYSLIVYASKENQQWVSSLIEQLDEYRPQVLLDVTLVEITKNDEFTLDLDLVSKFPKLEPGESMDKLVALIGNDPGVFPLKRITEAVSTAGAGGSAFYADEHIQALLVAMHKKGYGRVLARPKLLVNDNEAGTIKTEEQQTIVSPETTVVPGTAATAPTAHTSVKRETYSAGITLDIEPHISKGDQLRLTITLTRTDFRLKDDYVLTTPNGELKGPTPPDLLTSDVTTVVTVPDNTTIILGGLEKLSQSKGGTKVPILGDIPLIGGLFRSTANTDTQSRLYVFVKAHILRPGEDVPGESDIEVVSAKNRATFEKYEEEMQKYEDWPGITPGQMSPLSILEAD